MADLNHMNYRGSLDPSVADMAVAAALQPHVGVSSNNNTGDVEGAGSSAAVGAAESQEGEGASGQHVRTVPGWVAETGGPVSGLGTLQQVVRAVHDLYAAHDLASRAAATAAALHRVGEPIRVAANEAELALDAPGAVDFDSSTVSGLDIHLNAPYIPTDVTAVTLSGPPPGVLPPLPSAPGALATATAAAGGLGAARPGAAPPAEEHHPTAADLALGVAGLSMRLGAGLAAAAEQGSGQAVPLELAALLNAPPAVPSSSRPVTPRTPKPTSMPASHRLLLGAEHEDGSEPVPAAVAVGGTGLGALSGGDVRSARGVQVAHERRYHAPPRARSSDSRVLSAGARSMSASQLQAAPAATPFAAARGSAGGPSGRASSPDSPGLSSEAFAIALQRPPTPIPRRTSASSLPPTLMTGLVASGALPSATPSRPSSRPTSVGSWRSSPGASPRPSHHELDELDAVLEENSSTASSAASSSGSASSSLGRSAEHTHQRTGRTETFTPPSHASSSSSSSSSSFSAAHDSSSSSASPSPDDDAAAAGLSGLLVSGGSALDAQLLLRAPPRIRRRRSTAFTGYGDDEGEMEGKAGEAGSSIGARSTWPQRSLSFGAIDAVLDVGKEDVGLVTSLLAAGVGGEACGEEEDEEGMSALPPWAEPEQEPGVAGDGSGAGAVAHEPPADALLSLRMGSAALGSTAGSEQPEPQQGHGHEQPQLVAAVSLCGSASGPLLPGTHTGVPLSARDEEALAQMQGQVAMHGFVSAAAAVAGALVHVGQPVARAANLAEAALDPADVIDFTDARTNEPAPHTLPDMVAATAVHAAAAGTTITTAATSSVSSPHAAALPQAPTTPLARTTSSDLSRLKPHGSGGARLPMMYKVALEGCPPVDTSAAATPVMSPILAAAAISAGDVAAVSAASGMSVRGAGAEQLFTGSQMHVCGLRAQGPWAAEPYSPIQQQGQTTTHRQPTPATTANTVNLSTHVDGGSGHTSSTLTRSPRPRASQPVAIPTTAAKSALAIALKAGIKAAGAHRPMSRSLPLPAGATSTTLSTHVVEAGGEVHEPEGGRSYGHQVRGGSSSYSQLMLAAAAGREVDQDAGGSIQSTSSALLQGAGGSFGSEGCGGVLEPVVMSSDVSGGTHAGSSRHLRQYSITEEGCESDSGSAEKDGQETSGEELHVLLRLAGVEGGAGEEVEDQGSEEAEGDVEDDDDDAFVTGDEGVEADVEGGGADVGGQEMQVVIIHGGGGGGDGAAVSQGQLPVSLDHLPPLPHAVPHVSLPSTDAMLGTLESVTSVATVPHPLQLAPADAQAMEAGATAADVSVAAARQAGLPPPSRALLSVAGVGLSAEEVPHALGSPPISPTRTRSHM